MKIISQYKDYYDYLSGVWGEDPLIVLDRREFSTPKNCLGYNGILKFFIGGYRIEGFQYENKIYFGEDLNQFEMVDKYSRYGDYWDFYWFTSHIESEYKTNGLTHEDFIMIDKKYKDLSYIRNTEKIVLKRPIKDLKNINEKFNCPILMLDVSNKVVKNPVLKDFNINSVLPPEEAYQMIYDWLSLQKTKSENILDTRNDKLKIESKGFDNKTSFRPNMK